MRKILLLSLCAMQSVAMFAQEISSKVVLQKGDIIKMTSDMNSSNTMSMGGDPMESKTIAKSVYELVVKEVHDSEYVISQTLKTMQMDFDGFGQKMKYDSESKEKQDNQFTKAISEKVGVPEEFKLGFNGKVKEEETKTDKQAESKKGGGMMRMMNMGGNSIVEAAFLVIPQDAVAKGGWEETTEKEGLTTRKKYIIGAIMGMMATVTVQSQTKGEVAINRGGMSMTTKVNTISEETLMVNTSTGKVQMNNATITNNSKTMMGDKESPSTGKTTVTTTIE